MGVKQRVAALEKRKRKGELASCPSCSGYGVPVITYDGVADREGCAACGRSYVLMAFVGWEANDDGQGD